MEADSTTYDSGSYINNSNDKNIFFPFTASPRNIALYEELLIKKGDKPLECQIVERLQNFGLLSTSLQCPEARPDCNLVCKPARVVDRVQWVCEGCKKKQPIRTGSFFYKLQCSILQAMQMIFAWCEDAEITEAAEFFDVKFRTASIIYEKLDELTATQMRRTKLGGEGAAVLTEMYPDCLNRQSPDTTDQAHALQILMVADTKQIPTNYRLHVMKSNLKKVPFSDTLQLIQAEVQEVISSVIESDPLLVCGNNVPPVDAAVPLTQLLQHCDVEMQHFCLVQTSSPRAKCCVGK
ncbi:uncharacterized protein LOC126974886 isoform X2 [Leptidea sinapis]|uniref:uncharacterized protein LOC126974886 isoform X2 n=1 Tax=Leptidea sinapis TaxID=189913 RepID=UPI00212026CE|nr:uncharacterized protein LOC126974886 isoform X2 [Leptidea sinapis]